MADVRYYLGCPHEQYGPRELLDIAVAGEEAGFDGITCSDHVQPWWEPGESGHAWLWLGAAAQATERVPVGPAVTVALARYHPVLVAQGFATLEAMYPGRVFVGIGSGESLNESPVGCNWPDGPGQLEAMEEALGLIRRLWDGERVTHEGRFFRTKEAFLHTRPEQPPPLYVSAFHPGAARAAGKYGDGIWTLGDPETVPDLLEEYRAGCEEAGREPGEIVLQTGFSWAPDEDEALQNCRVWKGASPPEFYVDDWHDPKAMFEHADRQISDEEFKESFIVSPDPEEHAERIREIEQLGATIAVVNNCSGPRALEALQVYGEQVLPALRGTRVG
jgi:coenzyme F420-dependent glucose-6-phosphate dehydrogenase